MIHGETSALGGGATCRAVYAAAARCRADRRLLLRRRRAAAAAGRHAAGGALGAAAVGAVVAAVAAAARGEQLSSGAAPDCQVQVLGQLQNVYRLREGKWRAVVTVIVQPILRNSG